MNKYESTVSVLSASRSLDVVTVAVVTVAVVKGVVAALGVVVSVP